MKKIGNEIIGLVEKIADQNLKGENLDVLGVVIPSTIEEVGVLGVVISIAKGAKAVSDHLFCRAFENFTNQLTTLTPEQKISFINKYSKKSIQDFGEQALLLLNKIETPLASKMMGRAYYLLVANEIDEDAYLHYCFIIKQLNLYILKNIKSIFKEFRDIPDSGGLYTTLFNLGLMLEAEQVLYPGSLPPKTYVQSLFGWEFYNLIVQPFIEEF